MFKLIIKVYELLIVAFVIALVCEVSVASQLAACCPNLTYFYLSIIVT